MKHLLPILFILLFAVFSGANDDEPINENPVTLQFHAEPSQVQASGTMNVVIEMIVAPKHHAYKDMMKIKWNGPEAVTFDVLNVHPVTKFMDKFSKREREGVETSGKIETVAHFPANLSPGAHAGKIDFTYQACSERYCLFPKTISFDLPYTVVAGGEKPSAGNLSAKSAPGDANSQSGAGTSSGGLSEFQKALAKGKFMAFLFVFIAGFLTSLTPCVFPMIPITISIIGARAASSQKSKAFGLSLSYVLGIAMTYSLLGVLAASTGAFFGSALSNIYVVSVIALIFVGMGLSMLGLYELQVPSVVRNRLGTASTGTGIPGAFFAGLFAGIVASPCIGPVLVSILTYVAQTAQVVFGFFLLFCFAMGMGILFIVLGTFSGLLTKMPKAGPWMETIKVVFGITFIGMAFFYLYPVLPKHVFLICVAMMLFFVTSYYGAFSPAPTTPKEQLKKGMMLAGFSLGVLLMASVVMQQMGFSGGLAQVTSNEQGEKAPAGPHMDWKNYDERVVASIAQTHKPVIVDFYADWCVACHELDGVTYTDGKVIDESKKFDLLKVNATDNTPEVQKLQKQYGVVGLPTVLFIDANGKVRSDVTVTGFVKPDDFLTRMQRAER